MIQSEGNRAHLFLLKLEKAGCPTEATCYNVSGYSIKKSYHSRLLIINI